MVEKICRCCGKLLEKGFVIVVENLIGKNMIKNTV